MVMIRIASLSTGNVPLLLNDVSTIDESVELVHKSLLYNIIGLASGDQDDLPDYTIKNYTNITLSTINAINEFKPDIVIINSDKCIALRYIKWNISIIIDNNSLTVSNKNNNSYVKYNNVIHTDKSILYKTLVEYISNV